MFRHRIVGFNRLAFAFALAFELRNLSITAQSPALKFLGGFALSQTFVAKSPKRRLRMTSILHHVLKGDHRMQVMQNMIPKKRLTLNTVPGPGGTEIMMI